ncbi:hypothetical protein ABWH96_00150 [Marivirga tractuosa]|uniref:hypothetical protein n=1 Tax=Marivirga tractuosa TaxID=1006 RepID=UPI0035CEAF2C
MKRNITLCLSLFIILSFEYAFSQQINVSGYIRDASGKEKLIGAHIINTDTKKGPLVIITAIFP